MNMKKLATLVSAVALSATVSANAMAKDTIALVVFARLTTRSLYR